MSDRIERDVLLTAPAEQVWQALTDPALLEGWLAEQVSIDLRPGGEASFRVGGLLKTGWVEEVSPPGQDGPGRLAFWWEHDGEPATRVELTVEPCGDFHSRLRVNECRPLEILDLVGLPLPGRGGATYGPALVAVG